MTRNRKQTLRETVSESSREGLDRLHRQLRTKEKELHEKSKEMATKQRDEDENLDSNYCCE